MYRNSRKLRAYMECLQHNNRCYGLMRNLSGVIVTSHFFIFCITSLTDQFADVTVTS